MIRYTLLFGFLVAFVACGTPRSGIATGAVFKVHYKITTDTATGELHATLMNVELKSGIYDSVGEHALPPGEMILQQLDKKGRSIHKHAIPNPMVTYVSKKTDDGIQHVRVKVVNKDLYVNIPAYYQTTSLELKLVTFDNLSGDVLTRDDFKARRSLRRKD